MVIMKEYIYIKEFKLFIRESFKIGQEMSLNPIDFQVGRTLKGTFFGCYKSVDSVPKLVDEYLEGKIEIDSFITHEMQLDQVNEAFDLMVQGKSIRSVIKMY